MKNLKKKDEYSEDYYYDTEEALRLFAKKYNLEIIDAYGSVKGSYLNIPEFIIPNFYGQ